MRLHRKFDKLGDKVIQNIISINMGFLEKQYYVKELYCRQLGFES
jgi:hypothetical protein